MILVWVLIWVNSVDSTPMLDNLLDFNHIETTITHIEVSILRSVFHLRPRTHCLANNCTALSRPPRGQVYIRPFYGDPPWQPWQPWECLKTQDDKGDCLLPPKVSLHLSQSSSLSSTRTNINTIWGDVFCLQSCKISPYLTRNSSSGTDCKLWWFESPSNTISNFQIRHNILPGDHSQH